ncbi:hypothetical protein [Lysinibacillus xylanilyticus]|uniref:hypothetical protein n=1 Tax=Lysinibacillus xylanilyticus TaxID=582475 RepID=UPI0036D8521E
MTKFNVGDKVRVINASHGWNSVSKGDEGVIVSVNADESYEAHIPTFHDGTWTGEAYCFELVKPKQTKNQRITALEKTVAKQDEEISELKLIVHELRERPKFSPVVNIATHEPSTTNTVEDIIEFEGKQYRKVDHEAQEGDVAIFYGSEHPQITDDKVYIIYRNHKEGYLYHIADSGTDYFLDGEYVGGYYVYELIESKPLTPNQQRAVIIEKAKQFIEDSKDVTGGCTGRKGYKHNLTGYADAEFVVNTEKRTIVCLLKRQLGREILGKGIAKCNPSDVFNEHIGKAISLGRALGLDVSEFEQAVQPNEAVYGMIMERYSVKGEYREVAPNYVHSKTCTLGSDTAMYGRIINDTSAIYEEGQ